MKHYIDQRVREVANWLRDRFAENPVRVAHEMEMLAKSEGIAIMTWWHRPEVRELKIRPVEIEITAGKPETCWTTLPKGDDEP